MENRIKVLILSAGMISGAFRMMLDILEHIEKDKFELFVAYKPEYAEWGKHETDLVGSTAKIIPLRGKKLFDPRGFIDLWIAIKKEKIEILHSWDVLGIPARLIGKLAGAKIAEELANPPPHVPKDISFKHYWINKWTSFLVDGFVACSKEIQKKYYSEKPVFLKNKIFPAINNCVEAPAISLTHEYVTSLKKGYGIKSNEITLTNIGYFNEQKAQTDLLKAFKTVTDGNPRARLFLVGWGRLEKELKRATKDLGIEQVVTFTGKLNRSEVFEVLAITDLFVLSSHWEGFGIVMAEAMALGKPVIATDTDGAREVVKDGETGILVPIKRPDLMAQAILKLLEEPGLMSQMGEQGLERVKEHFTCEKFITGYEQFYLDVLHSDMD
jgi:glycosyltransferase involved in cell wall biosynthesis